MPTNARALADEVLPLIRTRSDLYRWSAANAHGAQMLQAVEQLREAARTEDPATVLSVTQRAIASSVSILLRADDSSGIIGDAVTDLLDLHADTAVKAAPPARRLVDWMIAFQFDGKQDFFDLDVVRYAPALREAGLAAYRTRLDEIEAEIPPGADEVPAGAIVSHPEEWERWGSATSARTFLEHNRRRLAVLDRDVDAIIATHARDQRVAAWLEDTARAFEEIGRFDLALDWAEKATHHDLGHQSAKAAGYWCALVAQHRRDALVASRLDVLHRWPTSGNAAALKHAAGVGWTELEPEVHALLQERPREAVLYALQVRHEPQEALTLLDEFEVRDADLREAVADALAPIDPAKALPLLGGLVQDDLTRPDAYHYRLAARRLARMRKLARGTEAAAEVDEFIGDLRETYRRRPRLQLEFDRARLP